MSDGQAAGVDRNTGKVVERNSEVERGVKKKCIQNQMVVMVEGKNVNIYFGSKQSK